MRHCIPLITWIGLLVAGCAPPTHDVVSPYLNYAARDRGLVVVLTGVEGRSPLNEAICEGLADGGVTWAIDLADWTSQVPMNYLVNLRDEPRNRIKAQEIADYIVRYRMAYPTQPVVLVGQSSGGGMAIWTAEALPPTVQIDGIVTLAPSLSPGYPLDSALEHCRRGIVNFHSDRDWLILGVGTTLSGTMDGMHTSSAGRIGFQLPLARVSAELYAKKLFQVPWEPTMTDTGHHGLHLTSGARVFVAAYVAPLVLEETWNAERVRAIVTEQPTPMTIPSSRSPSGPGTSPTATTAPGLPRITPYPAGGPDTSP